MDLINSNHSGFVSNVLFDGHLQVTLPPKYNGFILLVVDKIGGIAPSIDTLKSLTDNQLIFQLKAN